LPAVDGLVGQVVNLSYASNQHWQSTSLSGNNTNVRTEYLAGLTTFLTMAYFVVVRVQIV
jgi:hypothetical protein